MIDASNITNYNLTDDGLEEMILFWVCAAGKNGTTATKLLNNLLLDINGFNLGFFNAIKKLLTKESLCIRLKEHGIGCYTHKARTMWEIANSGLNLKTCLAEDLETIYGIGMKTSRCFIIHTREKAQYAGIDTHMLKNLKAKGIKDVPKSTPSSKKLYERLEKEVLRLAQNAGMSPADYDLKVWNKYSVK